MDDGYIHGSRGIRRVHPGEALWLSSRLSPAGRGFKSCLQVLLLGILFIQVEDEIMTEDEQDKLRANPGYALTQLAKALLSKGENAAKHVQQWQQVITGMANGALQVGSRAPVAAMPPWVTLEVIHGGFATGGAAAGGKLKQFEVEKARELKQIGLTSQEKGDSLGADCRAALNLYYVSEDGRAELSEMLKSGCFRVQVPEEAALLIATWLMEHGENDRATELLETLGLFFDGLRFYPEPNERPLRPISEDTVYLRTAGYCVTKLREKRQQQSVVKMNESIKVWTPLYDRAVNLFLETLEGDIPELERDQSTKELARNANGQPTAKGGWPCKRYPDGWDARAKELLKDHERASESSIVCKKFLKPKENYSRLRHYLEIACNDKAKLSARDIGSIRKILASYVTAHGAPGSERLLATRSMQTELANRPLHTTLARVLAERLEHESADEGVADIERLLVPLTADEAAKSSIKPGYELPPSITQKALGCAEGSIKWLIQQNLITSSESMAIVLPMLTGRIRASRIEDANLSRVFEAVYRAFRKRRSLLLLNLESQVRIEELPWISAIQPWIGSHEESKSAAHAALTRAAATAISSFPQTIIPNKLVKELRALAKDAELKVPIVDELAADIFTGSFSANYLESAHDAGRLLRGTLYERYYGVDYAQILKLDDLEQKWKVKVSPGFARICNELAHQLNEQQIGRSVAFNGAIIEQAQILTTHSLASLWKAVDLATELQHELPELARSCYRWVCHQLQISQVSRRSELKSTKNCAYAWRQMLFYISLCSKDEQEQFLSWTDEHFEKQSDEFKTRFRPAQHGLRAVARGDRFDNYGKHSAGGIRFLGWSKPNFAVRTIE